MSDPLLSSVHPLESQWALKASKSWLPSKGAVYLAESQVRTCPPNSFSIVQTLCFRTTTQVAKKKKRISTAVCSVQDQKSKLLFVLCFLYCNKTTKAEWISPPGWVNLETRTDPWPRGLLLLKASYPTPPFANSYLSLFPW